MFFVYGTHTVVEAEQNLAFFRIGFFIYYANLIMPTSSINSAAVHSKFVTQNLNIVFVPEVFLKVLQISIESEDGKKAERRK